MNRTILIRALICGALAVLTSFSVQAQSVTRTICDPAADSDTGSGTGYHKGLFFTWFELSQGEDISDCKTKLGLFDDGRHIKVEWDMGETYNEDAVGGMGWAQGTADRKFDYNVTTLESNSALQKALVAVYGWSCLEADGANISQEYYIVEAWSGGGQFVPWDENANEGKGAPATTNIAFDANGGTYDVYKVGRNGAQYCFDGQDRKFEQIWSVRKKPIELGQTNRIDFELHANRWGDSDIGFLAGGLPNGYQILGAEIFGDANVRHSGTIEVQVWEPEE